MEFIIAYLVIGGLLAMASIRLDHGRGNFSTGIIVLLWLPILVYIALGGRT